MRKIGPIAIIALFAGLTFTSCKKDYTCECKASVEAFTEGDSTVGFEVTEAQDTMYTYAYTGISKKDANSRCDGSQATLSAEYKEYYDNHATVNCDIK